MKTFFFFFLGGGGGGSGRGEVVGGHRVDVNKVFVKIKKKKNWLGRVFFFFGGGGQGGCERRIEVFVKIQKKNFWGGVGGRGRVGGGVRVDVNEELNFL